MSADNAHYVAGFADGTYRVGYGSASVVPEIDSHFYSPQEARELLEVIFGDSEEFTDKKEACLYALELEETEGPTEYGVWQIEFPYNLGDTREVIPEPDLPEGACEHCSSPGGTTTFHGVGTDCDRDPTLLNNQIVKALREQCPGINPYYVARIVMEVIETHDILSDPITMEALDEAERELEEELVA